MGGESNLHFLCTSYVREQPQGPLHITAVANGVLRVVSVLYGTEKIRLRLATGESLDEVVATLQSIQHTDHSFPIDCLRKIVWSDFSADIVFTHIHGDKSQRTRTCIASNADRDRLLLCIDDSKNSSAHCYDELASVAAVAWSRILGAVMALVGTIVFTILWDPVRVGRVRGGALALLLGRTGCALVGIGVFAACCISAWIAIRKQSRYYVCEYDRI